MWPLLLALFVCPVQADDAPPFDAPPFDATATISPDGRWTLVLIPDQPWLAAEVTVRGAGSFDLAPQDGTRPVELSGLLEDVGTLRVDLSIVTAAESGEAEPGEEGHGESWSFQVEPELLPTAPPQATRNDGRRRGFWPFRGARDREE